MVVGTLKILRLSLSPLEPCAPTGIDAILDCQLGTATLSWQNSAGAVSYTAVAETALRGHNVTCDTNATNCEMDTLACGEEYSVTVVARGDNCYSTAQMPGYLITGQSVVTQKDSTNRNLNMVNNLLKRFY